MKKIIKFAGIRYKAINVVSYEDFLTVISGRLIKPKYIDFIGIVSSNELLFQANSTIFFGIVYSDGFQKGSKATKVFLYEEVKE